MEKKCNDKRKLVDALKWVYTHSETKKMNSREKSNIHSDVSVVQDKIGEERRGLNIAVMIYGDIPKVIY